MANLKKSDPYRFAGKIGIGTGPIPLAQIPAQAAPTTDKAPTTRESTDRNSNRIMRPESRAAREKG